MQPNERFEDEKQSIQAMIDRSIDRVWTSMPVKVSKSGYNAQKQTVQLTITVKGEQKVYKDDGSFEYRPVSMPQLVDVPVHFPGAGGITLTWPIKDGDEGMVLFASRCIDHWWQNGDEQPRGSRRRHSLSDGMFIPGLKSQPNKLDNVSTTSTQLRTNTGHTVLDFAEDAISFKMRNGTVTIDQDANFVTKGNVTAGFGTSDKVDLKLHKHGGGPVPDPE